MKYKIGDYIVLGEHCYKPSMYKDTIQKIVETKPYGPQYVRCTMNEEIVWWVPSESIRPATLDNILRYANFKRSKREFIKEILNSLS